MPEFDTFGTVAIGLGVLCHAREQESVGTEGALQFQKSGGEFGNPMLAVEASSAPEGYTLAMFANV